MANDFNVISRKQAKSLGLAYYFSGKKCPHGHISKRFVCDYSCRDCKYERMKGEKFKASCKKWNTKNKSKLWEKEKERRAKPEVRERMREQKRILRIKNIEKIRKQDVIYTNRRRARKREAGGHFTQADIDFLLQKQKQKCIYCFCGIKKSYFIDHIQPLAKGGNNWPSNLQLTCRACNQKKHIKDPFEFSRSLGRLL